MNVSETELEDLIRQAPELIEEGLRFVDHQAHTSRGPLDVLLVDSGGALVVAELKIVEDDGMLVQAIDYYDFVYGNLDSFSRAYKQHKINPDQEPILYLIAPSFSVNLLNRIKWVNIPISLFTFQCIELEDAKSEILPIYKFVAYPIAQERIQAYSMEERFDYITDQHVRDLARDLITRISDCDPGQVFAEAIKYDVSIKHKGRVLGYLAPRRKFFLVYTYDSDGIWTPYRVDDDGGLEVAMDALEANLSP